MNVLVTGGTGYIGSHTCLELVKEGHRIIIVDNLSNSSIKCLEVMESILGTKPVFYNEDVLDTVKMLEILRNEAIDTVIHFAGLKAVGESVRLPLKYYENNFAGTLSLCKAMETANVKKLIFSSSATVYGDPAEIPISESCAKGVCTNPYGWTKSMIEQMLMDLHTSDDEWNIVLLRYFNPIGADESGLIGEDPKGIPNNLLPYVAQVAVGKLDCIQVYGNDYDTPDGTGVRDYIHVTDLAKGHVSAMKKLKEEPAVRVYNLGTGKGYSVLEVIRAFEKACNKKLNYKITDRRPGDIAISYANSSLAEKELQWKAKLGLEEMCRDSWNWQSKHPEGFE